MISKGQGSVFRVDLAAGAAKQLQLHPVAVEEVGADDKQAAELPHLHSHPWYMV